MNFLDVRQKHGVLSFEYVMHSLETICDNVLGTGYYELDENCWNGHIEFVQNEHDEGGYFFVTIGTQSMYDSNLRQQGLCSKLGYVLGVQMIFHELRHAIQMNVETHKTGNGLFSQEKYMENIVRRRFVSGFYHSVYTSNYKYDVSELDAELFGIQKTYAYFSSKENQTFVTEHDMQNILYDYYMCDDYLRSDIFREKSCRNLNDICSVLRKERKVAIHRPYMITEQVADMFENFRPSDYDMTVDLLYHDRYKSYREELAKVEDGLVMDKILEQTIVDKYPDMIATVPRLQAELEKCRHLIQTQDGHALQVISGKNLRYDMLPDVYKSDQDEDILEDDEFSL